MCRKRLTSNSLFRVSGLAATSTRHSAGHGGSGTGKHAEGYGGVMGIQIRGSFGTKIDALTRFMLHQEKHGLTGLAKELGDDALGGIGTDLGADPEDSRRGAKSLVFSQWEKVLDLVASALTLNGVKFVRLRGSQKKRGEALRAFNSDPDVRVFLLATGANNSGLTLVSAQSVFILEPSLNPAIEDQAINRVHRIGQTKQTQVFRFTIADSVEVSAGRIKRGSRPRSRPARTRAPRTGGTLSCALKSRASPPARALALLGAHRGAAGEEAQHVARSGPAQPRGRRGLRPALEQGGSRGRSRLATLRGARAVAAARRLGGGAAAAAG